MFVVLLQTHSHYFFISNAIKLILLHLLNIWLIRIYSSMIGIRKTILFSVGLILCCAISITSCSSSGNTDKYFVGPKDDMEFKGKSGEEVKEALQGTWYLVRAWNKEYTLENSPKVMIIKGDEIKYKYPNHNSVDSYPEEKWYKIMWTEGPIEPNNDIMCAFFPKYDNIEAMFYLPVVPFRIVENILVVGDHFNNPEQFSYYACVTEEVLMQN